MGGRGGYTELRGEVRGFLEIPSLIKRVCRIGGAKGGVGSKGESTRIKYSKKMSLWGRRTPLGYSHGSSVDVLLARRFIQNLFSPEIIFLFFVEFCLQLKIIGDLSVFFAVSVGSQNAAEKNGQITEACGRKQYL